ncbi:hypothetical protein CONPUDRAFT_159786 [Coniophora puteana RWD-64-598 SS2]|uniref:Uncharacterized protein n=1 Tax=Coniophora puteana (strain RWD-64-598) TaxID=741705 RepID=A0A5M3M7Y0_CONPW|nr:uncharacterized protein CONPUDRAFT_159786 [Coniophora puteana RWD-64-598 SS2]EIW75026.1 hypothetical protein CONPUDRAFT_159786 [Coniophora puteana RWD-64-598 SS2]
MDKAQAYEELLYFAEGNRMVGMRFIWRVPRWGMGKSLYVMAKYINFAMIPVSMAGQLPFTISPEACAPLFYGSIATQTFAITVSQCLFSLRNYAMWNGNRIAIGISIFNFFSALIIVSVLLGLYLPLITFGPNPIPSITGCFKTGGNNHALAGCFMVVLLNEARFRLRLKIREGRNQLLETLMRDGLLYCITIFLLSLINAVVQFTVSIAYIETTELFQSVLQTILATNMQLHLCRVHQNTSLGMVADTNVSSINFSDIDAKRKSRMNAPPQETSDASTTTGSVMMIGRQTETLPIPPWPTVAYESQGVVSIGAQSMESGVVTEEARQSV